MPDPGSAYRARQGEDAAGWSCAAKDPHGRAYVMQTHNKTRIGDNGSRLWGLAQPRDKGLRGISQADLGGYLSMFLSDSRRGDISHA